VSQVFLRGAALDYVQSLPVIVGRCLIETEERTLGLARAIGTVATSCGVSFMFKPAFDKANRTSLSSFRDPDRETGLSVLTKVKAAVGVPILTDIQGGVQPSRLAEVADVLQGPAALCSQTDLLPGLLDPLLRRRVAWRMRERHEHLLPAQPLLAHVGFHDRVAAREAILRA